MHKLISTFTQRMRKCVITKSREFYCRSQVSVWVTQPAAAVIFDHNVTALQLSCNGPLVTEQLWLCSNRGSDITNPPTATSERGKNTSAAAATGGGKSKQASKWKKKEKSLTPVCSSNTFVDTELILQMQSWRISFTWFKWEFAFPFFSSARIQGLFF